MNKMECDTFCNMAYKNLNKAIHLIELFIIHLSLYIIYKIIAYLFIL